MLADLLNAKVVMRLSEGLPRARGVGFVAPAEGGGEYATALQGLKHPCVRLVIVQIFGSRLGGNKGVDHSGLFVVGDNIGLFPLAGWE